MREDSCTPSLAKGSLLAREVSVQGGKIARGRVVGNDEIVKLNEAGVPSVDVIWLDLSDLLADAAVNHVNRRLVGPRLYYIPSREGMGDVLAERCGKLEYDADSLERFCRLHAEISIKALEPGSLVRHRQRCVTTKAIPLTVTRDSILPVLDELPALRLEPRKSLNASLYCHGTDDSETIEKISKRLKRYGSEIVRKEKKVEDAAALTIALAESGETDVALFFLANSEQMLIVRDAVQRASPIAPLMGPVDRDRLEIGMIGSSTVIATMPSDASTEEILEVLDLLHTDSEGDAMTTKALRDG